MPPMPLGMGVGKIAVSAVVGSPALQLAARDHFNVPPPLVQVLAPSVCCAGRLSAIGTAAQAARRMLRRRRRTPFSFPPSSFAPKPIACPVICRIAPPRCVVVARCQPRPCRGGTRDFARDRGRVGNLVPRKTAPQYSSTGVSNRNLAATLHGTGT